MIRKTFTCTSLMSAHQIRVHLQYLGYPIANDPLYSHTSVWGKEVGKGGVDLNPSAEALSAAEQLKSRTANQDGGSINEVVDKVRKVDLNDREYANIDAGSPILLSHQAREIIAKLRRARDEAEDWVKWVFLLEMCFFDRSECSARFTSTCV